MKHFVIAWSVMAVIAGAGIAAAFAPVVAEARCNLTGSYIAASGHRVVSPRCANGAGARYVCGDGSFSHAEHRRGACSRHGGIEREL